MTDVLLSYLISSYYIKKKKKNLIILSQKIRTRDTRISVFNYIIILIELIYVKINIIYLHE